MADSGDASNSNNEDADERLTKVEELLAEEEDLARKVQANVTEHLDSHIAKLEEELRSSFDERMSVIAAQCRDLEAESITHRQTDILRTNKVFRDIARPLGADWQKLFGHLMTGFGKEFKQAELEKVKREKPFMQAYKSLMTWKAAKGPDFNIRDLIEPLKASDRNDLVDMTLQILNSDQGALLSDAGGKGASDVRSASGIQSSNRPSQGTSCGSDGAFLSQESSTTNAAVALDDRHLLQLAKGIDGDWEPLARALNIPDDDVTEVRDAEGQTYQGTFKMLWNWRESTSVLHEGLGKLLAALVKIGKLDLGKALIH